MSSFNLSQIVSEPTRIVNSTSTLIDLAFTSTRRMVQLCETIPPLTTSQFWSSWYPPCLIHQAMQEYPKGKIWQYKLADFDQAVELLESVEWDNLLNKSDPSLYWSTWIYTSYRSWIFQSHTSKSTPRNLEVFLGSMMKLKETKYTVSTSKMKQR